ncbi:MAG: toll/interleukin-1 receptor domain-containing protein, partial [Chloroflexi bacterium]|nr:toll/interleukin-1 receptor domain-containing protein [Chloroflexota bacterium]
MADVFISYSRKDTDFIRELYDALNARQRETWVDWRGIDYSTKWWEEICAGIEGADNFVLVISPDALESVYCQREIEHARKHHKRIVTVLYREIDAANLIGSFYTDAEKRPYEQTARDNWEVIQAIQWIDHTKLGTLERTLEALLDAIDTDPARVRKHTRLLLRVREWEGRGRSPSALLRGDELAEYEAWQATSDAAGDEPRVTDEQRAYIAESRRTEDADRAAERQRERRIRQFRLTAVALALVGLLAVILALWATQRANSAQEDADAADARERSANTQAANARTEVAFAGQTLTPIPVTLAAANEQLTAVAMQVEQGEARIEALDLASSAVDVL